MLISLQRMMRYALAAALLMAAGSADAVERRLPVPAADHDYYDNGAPDPAKVKLGRERVTQDTSDRFRFRVPTLRNIALTAPYGHDGAFDTLEAVVRHHLDTLQSLETYDRSQAQLPPRDDLDAVDFVVMDDPQLRGSIAAANELAPIHLSEREIADLLEFLNALTDPASLDLRRTVPVSVPSGLPLAE